MTKTAVVTAGASQLGSAITTALAAEGWDVVITYVGDEAEGAAVINEARARGRASTAVRCDAGLKADADRRYAQVTDLCGAPGLFGNIAGVQTWSSLLDLAEEDWDRTIRPNLKGTFLNTQAAARLMVSAGQAGRNVNIGTGCNSTPFLNLVDYTASKGGIEMLTRVSAVELGPHGITVNCVAPGSIETERTKLEAPNYARDWSRITPLRRIGTRKDVSDAVCFLASDRAAFITGQT